MSVDRVRLERLLGGAGLAALRTRLRRRFERGLDAGAFTLPGLAAHERRALEGLLGRRGRRGGSMRISVEAIDAALVRAGLAPGLLAALEALDGPVVDQAAARRTTAARWARVFDGCSHPRLAPLLTDGGGRGQLRRAAGSDPDAAGALLGDAERVLDRLPAPGRPRSRLAAETLGDAHGLDDGRPVAALVRAVLAREAGARLGSRELWASAGILVNELAEPALALNLPARAGTPAGELAQAAASLGEPLHLSLRALARSPPAWRVAGRTVHVCENPAIVALAADRHGPACSPLVCTEGMPAAAQRLLLTQLAGAGARLRYHGDFDWPGIRIGNIVIGRHGALPWRFSARDYAPLAGRALGDDRVEARWDPALAPAMAARGVAVDEESIAGLLVKDLGAAGE